MVPLATMASVSATDGAIQRKMRGRGAVGARTGITLVISNEYMNNITKTIK